MSSVKTQEFPNIFENTTSDSGTITLENTDKIVPPTSGKFFYFDIDKDGEDGWYSVKYYKTDGTADYNMHLSTNGFYSMLYQTTCYACNSPNKYWVGKSGRYKS